MRLAGDNLSSILEMIRAELNAHGHAITLEQMRAAALPARREFGARRIYVEVQPKSQKLAAAQSIAGPARTRDVSRALGVSEVYAGRLIKIVRG